MTAATWWRYPDGLWKRPNQSMELTADWSRATGTCLRTQVERGVSQRAARSRSDLLRRRHLNFS